MNPRKQLLSFERLFEDKVNLRCIEMLSKDYISFASNFDEPNWARMYQASLNLDITTIPCLTTDVNKRTIKLNKLLIEAIEDRKLREPILGLIKELCFFTSYRAICQYEHSGRFVRVEVAHEAAGEGRAASQAASFQVLDDFLKEKAKRPKLKDVRVAVLKRRGELGLPDKFSDNQLERHFTAWRKARGV